MSLIKANAVQIGQSPTATQNFTLAVPSSPDGTIKLARGNSGATTQDVLSVDASGNVNGLVKSTGSTAARSLANRFADVVNVKDFGAVGDGVADDTAAINAAITNGQGKCIYFPKGKYSYSGNGTLILTAGTTILGDGKNTSIIKVITANPSYVFSVNGRGSGIQNLGFEAGITQTGGSWVKLLGINSYITDFWMDGDFNGIYFEANAGYIKNGKFDNAASGATRIHATGGDNSQVIDNVLMGAQPSSPNIAAYGIYVSNNVALTISNTSVIQMGVGLALISDDTSKNVLNFIASNCYFDNCNSAIKINASGTGSVNRATFNNVWAGNSQGSLQNGIEIINTSVNEIGGFIFNNCQCVLNHNGAGISVNGAVSSVISDVLINGGFYSDNKNGIYLGKYLYGVKVIGASIGKGGLFIGNSETGLFVDTNVSNLIVSNNIITFNTLNQVNYNSTDTENTFKNNIGFRTQYLGNATIPTGSNSVTFPHFCNITPNIYEVLLTPRNSLAAVGITSFWVSAITSTNITVTSNTNVTSNHLFNFYVATENA